jgi:hypothetical protein
MMSLSTPLRRWTALLIGLFLLFVAANMVAFRDNLFRWSYDPRTPFQAKLPPPAPDYSSEATWYLWPPAQARDDADRPAVFLVHPTTYWGRDGWNGPVGGGEAFDRLVEVYGPNAAAVFFDVGPIYAPLYRQASLYSALTHRFDAKRARSLARDDVLAAFETFLDTRPQTQPIILAGFEQGGLHLLAILGEIAKDPILRQRLVAAYVVDQAVPMDLFQGPLQGLTGCTTRDDVHCVVSFAPLQAENERELRRFQNRSMVWDQDGELTPTASRSLLCVNPVLGVMSEDFAPRRLHLGGFNAALMEFGTNPAPISGQTSAQCQAGILYVERPQSASLRNPLRWGDRFKPDQARLFGADLQRDIANRVQRHAERLDEEGVKLAPVEGFINIDEAPINKVED